MPAQGCCPGRIYRPKPGWWIWSTRGWRPISTRRIRQPVGVVKALSPGYAPPAAGPAKIAGIKWSGEVPPQKWMNFYTKVLSRFATGGGLKLTVTVDVAPPEGTTSAKIEETKVALRELGLSEDIKAKLS